MSEKKKGFDLAQVLNDVSNLDTISPAGRQQIEYISIDLISGDPANFYELSEIDALAANIELIGLQQPLRVRQHPDDESMVIIVSGHRRYAALRKLVDDGRDDLRDIPCIIDQSAGSEALQELRLIYANSDTRRMTSSDLNKQAERIEKLLYQLKEEGYEFPGRMRDHVAEVCKVSKTKLARLKMIRDNLHEMWQPAYQDGRLREACAYALSKLPIEDQLTFWNYVTSTGKDIRNVYEWFIEKSAKRFAEIDKFVESKNTCVSGCANREGKRMRAIYVESYGLFYCDKCCSKCPDLAKCKYSCPALAAKKEQLKADAKAQKQQEKLAEEERQRPVIEQKTLLWTRFGQARRDAQKSVKDVFEALCCFYSATVDDKEFKEYEEGCRSVTPSSKLPYGYSTDLSDINHLIKLADLFGVSLDYLLCRSPNPVMNTAAPISAPTDTEDLRPAVWYPASVEPPMHQQIIIVDSKGYAEDVEYCGASLDKYATVDWPDVKLWTMAPTEASGLQPPSATSPWFSGEISPAESTDAVAEFVTEGLTLRKLAHWDGRNWKFSKAGSTIAATCVRWFPIPAPTECRE